MKLFDVYPLFDVTVDHGKGCYVWDDKGQEYLDFYGGHAVISIVICEKRNVQKWKNETCKKFETWMVKIQVFLCLIMGVFVQKKGVF